MANAMLGLVLGLTAALMGCIFVIGINIPYIMEGFKMFFAGKKGYGKVMIIGKGNRIFNYIKPIQKNEEIQIEGNTYIVDTTRMFWIRNIPVMIFKHGVADALTLGSVKGMDSARLDSIIARALDIGSGLDLKKEKIMMMLMIGTICVSVMVLLMVFKMTADMGNIAPAIKALANQVKNLAVS